MKMSSTKIALAGAMMAAHMAPAAASRHDPYEIRDFGPEPLNPDNLPDRVCGDPNSPYSHPRAGEIAVKLDGKLRKNDVQEYCISEGWIKVMIRDRRGNWVTENTRAKKPILRTIRGKVEVFLKKDI